MATDPDYDRSAVIKAVLRAPHHATDLVKYTKDSIELILLGLERLRLVMIISSIG